MSEILHIRGQYYILATSSRVDDRTRVLKHGDSFAVFDRYGDVHPIGLGEQGFYHEGTRFLSRFEVLLGEERPLLLSSNVRDDNVLLAVDLANPDITHDGTGGLQANTIHLFRSAFLWQGTCYQSFQLRNFAQESLDLSLSFNFEADFSDIFEVRGVRRERRGTMLEPVVGEREVLIGYEGLDRVVRRTRLHWSELPTEITSSYARFALRLPPKGEQSIVCLASCENGRAPTRPASYDRAFHEACRAMRAPRAATAEITASNEQFNDWVNRSVADLDMMLTETPSGPYPYAGVPWFSTVFGRDGIITALEALWINPDIARGVLAYLAITQASEVIPEQDAEPGKILHETRKGELAALGEIPFGRYYGTIDATPLFIVLAGAYYERTGDHAFLERIWPNIERALHWIDQYGDLDGDGFVEYARRAENGLDNQGWKDSHDSVFHEDGTFADGPIALVEVQGYVYAAKRRAAEVATVLGDAGRALRLTQEAATLRDAFERAFWCEELSTYAIALDGRKQACRVRSSNAGHALTMGIATPEHAARVAETLLAEESFSGWGIRTVARSASRYNPMSYHNGSVWPHDTALVAAGLARYGHKAAAARILAGLFDASIFVDEHRLPELFCGFVRRPGEGPTLYPVACRPQSWAVGSVFLVLQAALGLTIHGPQKRVSFSYPALPEFLESIDLRNLSVGGSAVDVTLRRHGEDVSINVTRREGDVEILIVK